jgi:hypothetical protein
VRPADSTQKDLLDNFRQSENILYDGQNALLTAATLFENNTFTQLTDSTQFVKTLSAAPGTSYITYSVDSSNPWMMVPLSVSIENASLNDFSLAFKNGSSGAEEILVTATINIEETINSEETKATLSTNQLSDNYSITNVSFEWNFSSSSLIVESFVDTRSSVSLLRVVMYLIDKQTKLQ